MTVEAFWKPVIQVACHMKAIVKFFFSFPALRALLLVFSMLMWFGCGGHEGPPPGAPPPEAVDSAPDEAPFDAFGEDEGETPFGDFGDEEEEEDN